MTDTDVGRLFSFAVSNQCGDVDENGDGLSGRKQRAGRDPMSHRIIEKRRRDRMNNCLADLSQLIPSTFIKQGQGRIEKTEIIEMAIRHIKFLQSRVNSLNGEDHLSSQEMYLQGYQECHSETLSFFEEVGYCITESVFLRLKNQMDVKIDQLQADLKNVPMVGPKDSLDSYSNIPHNWTSQISGSGSTIDSGSKTDFSMGPACMPTGGSQEGLVDSGMGSSTRAGQDSSARSSASKSSHCREDDSKPSTYKFKQDIQQRFISHVGLEKRNMTEIATVPHKMPLIEDKEESKDPPQQLKRTEQSPSSLCQDNGNGSAYGSGSSVHSFNSTESSKSLNSNTSSQDISLNNTVPAFALHPMGYFYIPVVLPIAQVMPFIAGHKSMGVCHPVSIPVSFTGPFPIGTHQDNKAQAMTGGIPSFGGQLAAAPIQSMPPQMQDFSAKVFYPSNKRGGTESQSSRGTSKTDTNDSRKGL